MPFYLFSLAWCLKSSIAFLKSVTLYKPLSLSSNSSLAEKERGRCILKDTLITDYESMV